MDYISTDFGVDCLSLLFRVQTDSIHTDTDATDHPTTLSATNGVGSDGFILVTNIFLVFTAFFRCLQWFDAVGWAAGREVKTE